MHFAVAFIATQGLTIDTMNVNHNKTKNFTHDICSSGV